MALQVDPTQLDQRRLGWLPGRGTAPEQYLLRNAPPAPPSQDIRHKNWWMSGWWGDQGNTSECVIYSWLHALHDGPLTPKWRKRIATKTKPLAHPNTLYREGQAIDGTSPRDVHSGLTCNAGAQVMKRHGFIGEYRWAETVDELVLHLRTTGPALIGAWWYRPMFAPNADGTIEMDGPLDGGHQWVINGVDIDDEIFRNKNSWGRSWGRRGCFKTTFRQVDRMLDEGAEICVYRELPIELPIPA